MYIYKIHYKPATMIKKLKFRLSTWLLTFFFIFLYSCTPKINSFTVNKRTISANDTLQFNWDVTGHPTLLYHQRNITGPGTPDSAAVRYLEFTLVAQKNGKEAKKMIQVVTQPVNSTDSVVCATGLHGDTLIASCTKDSIRWGNNYRVVTVSSGSRRPLNVSHAGTTTLLDAAGTPSHAFEGTALNGAWRMSSLLTAAEKADMSTAAEKLSLIVTVKYETQ